MLCIKHTFFKVLHIFLFRGGAPVGGHSLWSVQWRQGEKKTVSRDPTQQAKNGGCEAALVVWQILFPGTLCGQCEVCAVGYVVWSGCYFSTGSQEGICHSIRSWSGEGVCVGGGRWKVGRLCVMLSLAVALVPWQAPIQVFGIEGRYAHALFSAASKKKSLEKVEQELNDFQVCITRKI